MKIVIDIPDDTYNRLKDDVYDTYDLSLALNLIRNSIPLASDINVLNIQAILDRSKTESEETTL